MKTEVQSLLRWRIYPGRARDARINNEEIWDCCLLIRGFLLLFVTTVLFLLFLFATCSMEQRKTSEKAGVASLSLSPSSVGPGMLARRFSSFCLLAEENPSIINLNNRLLRAMFYHSLFMWPPVCTIDRVIESSLVVSCKDGIRYAPVLPMNLELNFFFRLSNEFELHIKNKLNCKENFTEKKILQKQIKWLEAIDNLLKYSRTEVCVHKARPKKKYRRWLESWSAPTYYDFVGKIY